MFLTFPNRTDAVCLYGVISYGATNEDCGHSAFPTVAARVSYYIEMFQEEDLVEVKKSRKTRLAASEKTMVLTMLIYLLASN